MNTNLFILGSFMNSTMKETSYSSDDFGDSSTTVDSQLAMIIFVVILGLCAFFFILYQVIKSWRQSRTTSYSIDYPPDHV